MGRDRINNKNSKYKLKNQFAISLTTSNTNSITNNNSVINTNNGDITLITDNNDMIKC